jgi:nucleotide-binding universal stress UspA family protein
MTIKDLLLNLAIGVDNEGTTEYAISLARAFDAHLAAVAFAYDEVPPAMLAGEVPAAWIEDYRKQAQAAAQAAVGKFEEAAGRAGVSAQGGWLPATFTGSADLFARMTRRFDLSVIRQTEVGISSPAPLVIEAALFQAGRPALVVPYIQRTGFKLDRVIVGWDGSSSAARAVGDAMPFLERAKMVQVTSRSTSNRSLRPMPSRRRSCCPMRPIRRLICWCWAGTDTRDCASSSLAASRAAYLRR